VSALRGLDASRRRRVHRVRLGPSRELPRARRPARDGGVRPRLRRLGVPRPRKRADRVLPARRRHAATGPRDAPRFGPHLHAATHGCRDTLTCILEPICRRRATGDPEGMYASSTADLGRPAKLRLTPARLYGFAALLCGAGGLALGQPAGVRWALLVFGAVFLSAALQAALDPPDSTPGPQSPARRNSMPRRFDLRRAVPESRGRTRRRHLMR
jgi:hypothetical protein